MTTPPLSCLIIADDLTGACDTGVQFAQTGLRVRVATGPFPVDKTDVLVWDTETRNCAPAAAEEQVRIVCAHLAGVQARVWYKKIDSTLRGSITAELAALMEARGFSLCLLAPAFPAAGRLTVGGYHLLNGVPVARTEMGQDRGAPVRESHLPRLLADAGLEVGTIGLDLVAQGPETILQGLLSLENGAPTVVVCDAAAPEDLDHVARAAARMKPAPLLCGSAGLAGHVPAAFGLRGSPAPPFAPRKGGVLILAGSRHPQTRRQLEIARTRLRLFAWDLESSDPQELEAAAKPHLLRGESVIVSAGPEEGKTREEVARNIRALAQLGANLAVAAPGLVVTGGWTATELLRTLEAQGVEILEEIDTAVPLCRVGNGPFQGLPLVTKAGALGSEEVFPKILDRLVSSSPERPLLAITMGDPCGVGPEIIVKALADPELYRLCRPLVVGHPAFLEENLKFADRELSVRQVEGPEDGLYQSGTIDVLSPGDLDLEKIETGKVCPEGGRGAVQWVQTAADLALEGRVHGLVTAPLNKEAMNRAGFSYAGHTELLGEQTRTRDYRMMLAAERLKVVHATTHLALHDVPSRLTQERVFTTITLTQQALEDLGVVRPRIAVAGLNPHAGESGLFGREDAEIIRPAVEQVRAQGWEVCGPVPPDTAFYRAYQGEFDAVVAMYHDQGHVPVKLVAFTEAVNITLGLPIVRTSVDHGTAFDIAGKGVADHRNLLQAIRLGARLASVRKKETPALPGA